MRMETTITMFPVNWQIPATLVCVTLAAMYLVRCVWQLWRGKSTGCGSGAGSCGKCPSNEKQATPSESSQVVPLEVSYREK